MNNGDGILIIFLITIIPSLIITMLVCRWIFRIDEIADYPRRIADKLDPPIRQEILEKPPPLPPDPPKATCDCCHKEFPAYQLSEYSNNKKVCPGCFKFLTKNP